MRLLRDAKRTVDSVTGVEQVEYQTVELSRVVCLTVRKPISVPRLGAWGVLTVAIFPGRRMQMQHRASVIGYSKPHYQSILTCATRVSLVFPEMPKMATQHERQVVHNLRLQLAHARHDGGRSL